MRIILWDLEKNLKRHIISIRPEEDRRRKNAKNLGRKQELILTIQEEILENSLKKGMGSIPLVQVQLERCGKQVIQECSLLRNMQTDTGKAVKMGQHKQQDLL